VSRTLLFADVLGFSQLSDSQVASYCEVLLGEVEKLVANAQNKPLELNTWGDGLFMVFEEAGTRR
jgi:class 3 adenylate cyclase